MGGVLRSAMGLVKTATGGANSQKAEQVAKATRTSPADVVRLFLPKFYFYFYLIAYIFSYRFLGVVVKILKQVQIPKKLVTPLAQ
jgi:hypothetical protein